MPDNAAPVTQAAPAAPSTPASTETASTPAAPSTWSSWSDVETHPSFGSLDDGVKTFWKSGAEGLSKRAAELEAESQRYLQLVSEANPDLSEYRKRAEAGDKYKTDFEKATGELATLRQELEAAKAAGATKAELDAIRAEVAASKAEVEAAKKAHTDEVGSLKTSHAEALNNAFLDTALKYHDVIAEVYPQLVKTVKNAEGVDTYEWSNETAKAVLWQLLTKNGASIEGMPSIGAVMKELGRLVAQPEAPGRQAQTTNGGSGGAGGSLATSVEAEAAAIVNNPKLETYEKQEALSQLALKHRMTPAQKDDIYAMLYPDLAKLKKR